MCALSAIVMAMKLVVKGVNLTVTPSLRRYVDGKLVRSVEKLLSRHPGFDAVTLDIELVRGTRHHKKGEVWEAIVNLRLPQHQMWQRASAGDIHAAVDALEDILKRDITKYKERSRSRLLRGARQAKRSIRFDRSARLSQKGRIREEGI